MSMMEFLLGSYGLIATGVAIIYMMLYYNDKD